MASHTQLRGFENVGESLLSDQLEANLVEWFNWGMLGKGGFFNVMLPGSGAFGGSFSRLRLVDDPYYTSGQLWEGIRRDWVWESGVEYSRQPIHVSGVYVDGAFHAITATGVYSHHVNYPLGQVLFDSPISPSSVVTCEYSYRQYQVQTGDVEWFQQIQYRSQRSDDFQFLQQGSGAWSILGQNRFQLPALVVEAVPRTRRIAGAIGSLNAIVSQDVDFHIVTETKWDRKQLHDILGLQWQKRLVAFDKNVMLDQDSFPLDEYGQVRDSAKMYPQMVEPTGNGGFGWERQFRIMDVRSVEQRGFGPLYYSLVRATLETDVP